MTHSGISLRAVRYGGCLALRSWGKGAFLKGSDGGCGRRSTRTRTVEKPVMPMPLPVIGLGAKHSPKVRWPS